MKRPAIERTVARKKKTEGKREYAVDEWSVLAWDSSRSGQRHAMRWGSSGQAVTLLGLIDR